MKRKYDLIVALGGDPSCARALRLAELQFLAFAFDETEALPLAERLETVRMVQPSDDASFVALDRHLRTSHKVLLVWADVPKGVVASDDDCRAAAEVFRSRWPHAAFDVVAFRQNDGSRLGDYEIAEVGNLRTVAFDYRFRQENAGACDHRLLGGWLKKEYAVDDYRTQGEKDEVERRRREQAAKNLQAMGALSRLVTKWQLALFAALRGHLLRLGVIEK